jgi:hypothetical protein
MFIKEEQKIVTKKKAGKKDFRIDDWQKKGVHFFGKGYCEKCTGMKQRRKRRAKKIYCKITMPIIFIKGSCVETLLYTICWVNKDGDKGQV